MSHTTGHADRRRGVTSPDWILGKVIDTDVLRDTDWEYRVRGHEPRGQNRDDRCTDTVYVLEAAGLVTLHHDGLVTATEKGRARHAANQTRADRPNPKRRGRTGQPAPVVFQAA